MTAAAGIPGVPTAALDAIQDENTRMVLRAIVDGWQVRNGNTGKRDNRFVTAGELGSVTGARMIGGLSQSFQQEIGKQTLTPGEISRVISDLQASVMESALWKSLGERVTLIDKDLIAGLTAEAIARQAAITNEATIRQSADTSLASQVTTITASVNTNAAAIQTEQTARVNGDNALASQITTQVATVNGNVAALQTQQIATANNVSALTTSVSTLQASVGDNTAALATEASVRASADGALQGQYTVKIDLNGHVSGFGLASTLNNADPFSEFIVRADRFAIGAPTVLDGVVPFIVTTTAQTTNGKVAPPGVYIENGFIKNGSITTANIGLAQVDTLLIQGNAVTVPFFAESSVITTNATTTTAKATSGFYTLEAGSLVMAIATGTGNKLGSFFGIAVAIYLYNVTAGTQTLMGYAGASFENFATITGQGSNLITTTGSYYVEAIVYRTDGVPDMTDVQVKVSAFGGRR